MISVPTIVKVGGSLYDLPDLGPRLSAWLATQTDNVILVPGGGPMVETIRQLDRTRHLGEEACHWLALRMLTINAHFLAHLLPDATIISDPKQRPAGAVSIMDMCPFTLADEARPGRLPHSWAVSSDSLAMRVAIMAEARHLVLLKSTGNPQQMLARNFFTGKHCGRLFPQGYPPGSRRLADPTPQFAGLDANRSQSRRNTTAHPGLTTIG